MQLIPDTYSRQQPLNTAGLATEQVQFGEKSMISRKKNKNFWITSQIIRLVIGAIFLVSILGTGTYYFKIKTYNSLQEMYSKHLITLDGLQKISHLYNAEIYLNLSKIAEYRTLKPEKSNPKGLVNDDRMSNIEREVNNKLRTADSLLDNLIHPFTEKEQSEEKELCDKLTLLAFEMQYAISPQFCVQDYMLSNRQVILPIEDDFNIVSYQEHLQVFNVVHANLSKLILRKSQQIIADEDKLATVKNVFIVSIVSFFILFIVWFTKFILRKVYDSFHVVSEAFDYSKEKRQEVLLPIQNENNELAAIATIMNSQLDKIELRQKFDTLQYKLASIGRNADNLHAIAEQSLRLMAEETHSLMAALYIKLGNSSNRSVRLVLEATFASQKPTDMKTEFLAEEGLVGECLVKKTMLFAVVNPSTGMLEPHNSDGIKKNSLENQPMTQLESSVNLLQTGITEIPLQYHCAIPFIFQEDVLAVAEFASANPYTPDDIQIFEVLIDSFSAILNTAQATERIEQLLLESQAQNAEIQLQNSEILEQKSQIESQIEQTEKLLQNILPKAIAQRLKTSSGIIADRYDNVSVLFADMVGFTKLSSTVGAEELVQILNWMFSEFDDASIYYGLEKIKTIGDCYMVAGGIPEPDEHHAVRITFFAKRILDTIQSIASNIEIDTPLRIGIHSGSCVAGVIGKHKFAYDLWGDSVNIASRMESHGDPNKIHVSAPFVNILLASKNVEKVEIEGKVHYKLSLPDVTTIPLLIEIEERGTIEVKNKGEMKTYFIHPLAQM